MNGNWVGQSMDFLTFFFNWPTLSWAVTFFVLTAVACNLASAKRNGWAWTILACLLSIALLIIRGAASLFREVASDYDGTGGWDSE